jgi:phage terminase large subunit-like protein
VVLEDASISGGPSKWANAAVNAYQRWNADRLVAESNNGGEMVSITIGTVAGAPPVKLIHASRGKLTRAEPIQKLAEEGRMHHAGVFVALESELVNWSPGDPSPNRLDAYVWAATEAVLQPTFSPPRRHSVSTGWR